MERSVPQPSLDTSATPHSGEWDRIAEEYRAFIKKGDVFRTHLIHPVLYAWLGEVSGKRILDAGCGEGSFAHALAARGAMVTGVDSSRALLRIAEEVHRSPALMFREADLRAPLPFPDHAFDAVVSTMVFMDLHPMESAMRECARVLRLGGTLLLSIPHPCFASGKVGKTFLEKLFVRPPHYRVARYMTPFMRPWQIQGVSKNTPYYHRPLRAYAEALREAGFHITDLEEPVFTKEFAKRKNNFIKLSAEVPPILMLKAEKG